MKPPVLILPPNRVRRNYPGGFLLDILEGNEHPEDSDKPEDWIASTVEASNPGLPVLEGEGLSTVLLPSTGCTTIKALVESDPVHYLGQARSALPGLDAGFLVKLLDSATRLNVQAHPTREFAATELGVPKGKLEFYYIVETREGVTAEIRLGFQHPPSRHEFLRAVSEQDVKKIDSWFDPVPVHPGEAWLVPGGFPHAIGGGILLVEVMEPTDFVVRLEFERGGFTVPPPARFMGRDVEFAARMVDFTPRPVEEVIDTLRFKPGETRKNPSFVHENLVDSSRSRCFRVDKLTVLDRSVIDKDDEMLIGVVVSGAGSIIAADDRHTLRKGSRFLVPAATRQFTLAPAPSPRKIEPFKIIACTP